MVKKQQFNPFGKWSTLLLMSTALFIIVFDSTAMSVAIKNLIVDLHTDVETVRNLMSIYTLVVAALIMGGAKLGDVWGIKRSFIVGAVLFGIGAVLASLSTGPETLLLGWSVVEGTGAAIMLPAVAVFLTNTYSGKDRAFAFAVYAGIMAVAAALGPILGGFITTFFSWRWVFASEVIIILFILVFSYLITDHRRKKETFDVVGLVLSAASLSIIIFAVLVATTYGWLYAEQPFMVGETPITIGDFSIVPFLIILGIVLFYAFKKWCDKRKRENKTPLLDFAIFENKTFTYGAITGGMLNLSLLGIMFIFPVYLQLGLNRTAFETGLVLLPISASIIIFSLLAGHIKEKFNNKYLIVIGLLISIAGLVLLFDAFSGTELVTGSEFYIPLSIFGAGLGFVLALLDNITISSLGEKQRVEGSGVMNSASNMGASLGTALVGTALILFFITGVEAEVASLDAAGKIDSAEFHQHLHDFAMVLGADHSGVDFSGYSQTEVTEFKRILVGSSLYGMKMSFLLLIILFIIVLLLSLRMPLKSKSARA